MTWDEMLETATTEELYEAAHAQIELGHPVPVDVMARLTSAGYWIND